MNPILKEILQTGFVRSPSGKSLAVHSQISRKDGEFLQEIIAQIKPESTLEIGCAYGIRKLWREAVKTRNLAAGLHASAPSQQPHRLS